MLSWNIGFNIKNKGDVNNEFASPFCVFCFSSVCIFYAMKCGQEKIVQSGQTEPVGGYPKLYDGTARGDVWPKSNGTK